MRPDDCSDHWLMGIKVVIHFNELTLKLKPQYSCSLRATQGSASPHLAFQGPLGHWIRSQLAHDCFSTQGWYSRDTGTKPTLSQEKTVDSKQCMTVSGSPRWMMRGVITGRLKPQEKFQEVRNSRKLKCLLKKCTGCNDSSGGKDHVCVLQLTKPSVGCPNPLRCT